VGSHFNWVLLLPGVNHENIHIATALIIAAVITLLAIIANISIRKSGNKLKPADKLSVRGFFEVITEILISISDMVIGERGRKYVPMYASIFIYVLFSNLIGLLPGWTASTDNLNTTLAVGLFSYVVYNYHGIKEQGLGHYLAHFLGPVALLAPLIFIIEIFSHAIRPISLGLRLRSNMVGDHTIVGIFLDFCPAWLPIPAVFYGLGLFVCVLQAFVFVLLSMVYISMATASDH
jgi:F-type H+-transporting ATPase subunit a